MDHYMTLAETLQARLTEVTAERDAARARVDSVYEYLKAYDNYSSGDSAVCAREVLMVLSERLTRAETAERKLAEVEFESHMKDEAALLMVDKLERLMKDIRNGALGEIPIVILLRLNGVLRGEATYRAASPSDNLNPGRGGESKGRADTADDPETSGDARPPFESARGLGEHKEDCLGWEDCECRPGTDRERELLGQCAALREALEQLQAGIGDRLLGKGPLSKEYAHAVMGAIRDALASTTQSSRDHEERIRESERERTIGLLEVLARNAALRTDSAEAHGADSETQGRLDARARALRSAAETLRALSQSKACDKCGHEANHHEATGICWSCVGTAKGCVTESRPAPAGKP